MLKNLNILQTLMTFEFLLSKLGYNPIEQKENCQRSCGNISVPFPFGIEEGCFARKLFQLNCTNTTSSGLQFDDEHLVTYIDINEGLVGIKYTLIYEQEMFRVYVSKEPGLYISSGESSSVQWAVANLTCQEAMQNKSGYACVSISSTCLGVNSTDGYIGYRCQCLQGSIHTQWLPRSLSPPPPPLSALPFLQTYHLVQN
jgi:hypothetical protein